MIELFKIAGKIDLEGADKANKELDGVDKKAKGTGSKLGGFAKKVGKAGAIAGGAAAAAGAAAFAMTNKVTSGFDRIAKTSTKLGVSTDAFQEMEYWASQNGISAQTMERGIGRLNQRMGRAAAGNEKYTDALTNLGINMEEVKDGTLSTEDAMSQSIKALSEMSSEQEKSAAASELFGTKMARDLMPALQDGSLSLEDAKAKAEELGIVIGEDSLSAASKFQDTWDDLTRSTGAVGQKLMAELMPAFQTMMDWVLDHMPQIQSVISGVFDVIGVIFSGFKTAVQAIISALSDWFSSNEETMNGIWSTIKGVFDQVVSFLRETWETIKHFWKENGQAILENAIDIFESIRSTVETVFNAVWDIIQQVIGYVVPFLQEKLAVIQKFWDENGEQIMQAVQNAFSIIQGIIETVMPIIQNIIKHAWNIISAAFDAAVGIIMGIVKTLASLLTGDFEGIKEGLTDIWNSLWDGIKGIVKGAWGLLSAPFKWLWGKIKDWFGGLKDDALEWGRNMIQGFIDGIKNMGSAVADAAKGVVDSAADFIKFWSPSKKGEGRFIRHWGRNMVEGFLDGVRDEEDSAGKVMENVVKKMQPGTLQLDAMANVGSRGILQAANSQSTQESSTTPLDERGTRPIYVFQSMLNGRIVAEETFEDVTELQERDRIRNARARGE
jgi:phage-related protein